MGFTMFFTGLIISLFANQKRMTTWIIASTSITAILVFIPINLSKLTSNKMVQTSSTFSLNNLIFPAENVKNAKTFEVENIGNLSYHSLPEGSHFWSTGDGTLPAVNKQQIAYFRIYFHFVPQLRTTHLKDGFYSKKVTD
jgi:hypothetical protein